MGHTRAGVGLPAPDQVYDGPLAFDVRDLAEPLPPIQAQRPPSGAPNVLMVLLDDVGFGASSAFGGPIHTPTAERLANDGLKYTRFHTTALCSPTRAALVSGRNHHQVGMGHITETATPSPGYRSTRPNSTTPLAEILRQSGYNTAQFGKCHEVPVWESGPTGPFDHWPINSGFERFYGFIGGETNQWAPALIDGVSTVDPPDDPDYHLMEDLTEKTIAFIREQKTLTPDKPFFTYFAPGATHTPHHVPKEWIEKYKGRFDDGWDAMRAATVARQKDLGVIPADCDLTDRPEGISAWDDVADAWKPILCRQMEVYAGFLEYADTHVGRLVDALEELGILEDTLILYIIGDNGASAEGGLNGAFMITTASNGGAEYETPEFWTEHLDDLGGPQAYNQLRRRVGPRPVHPLSVDHAGGLALWRDAQRHDRPLAGQGRRRRRGPQSVAPRNRGMPVFESYAQPHGRFTGTIHWAQIDLGDDDHNHLIPPEAHLQAAMTHQ